MYCRCHLPLHQKEKLWESYPTGLIHEHDENSFHTTFSLLYLSATIFILPFITTENVLQDIESKGNDTISLKKF